MLLLAMNQHRDVMLSKRRGFREKTDTQTETWKVVLLIQPNARQKELFQGSFLSLWLTIPSVQVQWFNSFPIFEGSSNFSLYLNLFLCILRTLIEAPFLRNCLLGKVLFPTPKSPFVWFPEIIISHRWQQLSTKPTLNTMWKWVLRT